MQKQAPTLGRILAMVVFALSCFGIVLFLWLSFGGPAVLRPEGYRFQAQFDEAALLVNNADVRIAGLTVGKVKAKELQRHGGTMVEMEIDRDYAPIPEDTRAILRQKTLLGQIYIELTPGSADAPKLKEGATLAKTQVQPAVEIDELISTFDPETRHAWRGWTKELSRAIDGRGEDLNDAIGNFTDFATDGSELLETLDEQEPAVHRLVKNSGVVFNALNQRRGELRQLIGNANDFFEALASRNDSLAETIAIFPTFLDESRVTFRRLEEFSRDTRPLVRDLIPVAIQLRPTLADVGELAPDLENLFRNLDPLIDESRRNLPAAEKFLLGAEPFLEALHVWLPEFNPILSYLNYQKEQVADFITNGGASLGARLRPINEDEGPRHYLRQFSAINSAGLGFAQTRQPYDRGLAYTAPNYLKRGRPLGMSEAWDCKPNGEQRDAEPGLPPCFIQGPILYDLNYFPRLVKGGSLVHPPEGLEGSRPADPNR